MSKWGRICFYAMLPAVCLRIVGDVVCSLMRAKR